MFEHVEPDPAKWPHEISYQDYLNSLDEEHRMLMELIFCEDRFQQMSRWNFDNPLILELRYKDIVGAEEAAFSRLFDHYGFDTGLRQSGMEIVERLSLKNQVKKRHPCQEREDWAMGPVFHFKNKTTVQGKPR